MRPETFYGVRLQNNEVEDIEQWPQITCSGANQIAFGVETLPEGQRIELHFQGAGQISTESHDLSIQTPLTVHDKLDVEGTVSAKDIEVKGTLKANAIEGEGAVVAGMIIMWHGNINDIPKGWVLCDGRNGTPDLRDRFVMGSTTDERQRTGGQNSHTHNVSSAGSHNHSVIGEVATKRALHDVTAAGKRRHDVASDQHTHSIANNGVHSHSLNTSSNLPPYYKLAFIMKR